MKHLSVQSRAVASSVQAADLTRARKLSQNIPIFWWRPFTLGSAALLLLGCLLVAARIRGTVLRNGASPADPAASSPNVIAITIDTLRADHLGCYGYKRIATPAIDQLAAASARFIHAYSAVPITLPSHACIFTGSYPMATGMHDFSGNSLSPNIPTLATVLRNRGYSTAAFIAAAVLDPRFGLNQGFDVYSGHFNFSRLDEANLDQMERPGNEVMDEALAWLKKDAHQPFFLWIHLYDAHYPYTTPEPFASRYRDHPYDGGIAFDDAQVGRLLAYLKANHLFDPSLIVLCADHGEGLGEHGEKTHGFFIYNSTLHVPLLIKIPRTTPSVVNDDVSLVDIMPTVLQALKIPVPGSVQGRSLLSLILGRSGQTEQLYAETYLPLLHFHWSALRAIQSNGLKFIEAPRPELYDTKTDPHELKNLDPSRRSMANEMHNRLSDLERRYTPASGDATAEKMLTDPTLYDRLRSLGYVAISPGTFSDASGKPLPDPKDRIQVYELFSDAMADGQHGRYKESIQKLHQAEKTERASMPIHYLMALDEYRLKDFPAALEQFRTALEIDPKDALATYYQGLTQLEMGDLDAAAVSFSRALELDPTNFSAAYNLGAVELKKNQVQDALNEFHRAVEINPDYALGYVALGELELYLKRTDEAVHDLERAVELAPGSRRAHYNLGRAYQAEGRTGDADRELGKARSLGAARPTQ